MRFLAGVLVTIELKISQKPQIMKYLFCGTDDIQSNIRGKSDLPLIFSLAIPGGEQQALPMLI